MTPVGVNLLLFSKILVSDFSGLRFYDKASTFTFSLVSVEEEEPHRKYGIQSQSL